MNTSHGWARAKLQLRGLKAEYNSLREAYLISAIRKQDRIELKKEIANVLASAGSDPKEAITDYIEEAFPSIKEKRKEFIDQNKSILEGLAGDEIDLSKYKRLD